MSRSLAAWSLVAGSALLGSGAAALADVLPGVVASLAVAVVGAVGAVLSSRGSQALDAAAGRRLLENVWVDRRGRVPRVRDVAEPLFVGVHRAARVSSSSGYVPTFVRRDRSDALEAAVRRGGFVLVVGDSTAGKTRAAFEATRRCLPDHAFVFPDHQPGSIRSAVAAARDERRCVLWLDDLERYLGSGGLSVHHLHELLGQPGPRSDQTGQIAADRVVLATMRAQEHARFRGRAESSMNRGGNEEAVAGREVLGLVTEIRLARAWTSTELARAAQIRDDPEIASALAHADRYGVAEYLAAGPDLLARWLNGWAPGTHPRGAALVAAAVDARRAGCSAGVPLAVLQELHEDYLAEHGGARLRPEPWEQAVAWALETILATASLLASDGTDRYSAFDYLLDAVDLDQQAGPVPETTWTRLLRWAGPDDAAGIGRAAWGRGRVGFAALAFRQAVDGGHLPAAAGLARCLGYSFQEDQAIDVLRTAVEEARRSPSRLDRAELHNLRYELAWWTGNAGHVDEALRLAEEQAVEATALFGPAHRISLDSQLNLARWAGESGDPQRALQIARDANAGYQREFGDDDFMSASSRFEIAIWTDAAGDQAGAIQLLRELEAESADRWGDQDRLTIDVRGNLAALYGRCQVK
ncbi:MULTISPECIES: tetratricopeptide repeat protein [Pseudofrankia]|uniref:tetratricopeptide repeat protein n=1 Tax=Pseudofrankia TaxID=2994363 RepID=UPI000234C804|nr:MULTISPECIES: tetratricopeptide repeat protein [Pseudofrankia]